MNVKEKEYKKLENILIKKIFKKLKYKKTNYILKKTKHEGIATKIFLKSNKKEEIKYVFDMLYSQTIKQNLNAYLNLQKRKTKKYDLRNKKPNSDLYITFLLDRNIDINIHYGLLKLIGIL